MSDDFEALKAKLKERKKSPAPRLEGISSGSTLLNLALTGDPDVGYPRGLYTLLVGDSSSGKTWLTMTALAEAARDKRYKDYRFIFDNAENGALMDVGRFFGRGVAQRMEPPAGKRDDPIYSTTLEEFYYHVDDAVQRSVPFVYILDSMDALTTEDEREQFQKEKKASANGKDVSGSYGTSKAKRNSSGMRVVTNALRDSGSILIVVSQTRDNIGFGAQFNPKTRAGGRALRFFARLEIWTSIRERLKRKERQVGIICEAKVEKNHLTGWQGKVEIPIYRTHGMDDVGGNVRFLTAEKYDFTKLFGASPIPSGEERIIRAVEQNGQEEALRQEVARVWQEIEEACAIRRKKRYE